MLDLPPELILLIIREAAVRPEALGWTGWSKGAFILRQRHALLRRCSLVCRAWRPCAQSLLYETLYIDANLAKLLPDEMPYPTKRIELEVPNKLDEKGTAAAQRLVMRAEGVEELCLEVSEKVGGDWTEFLRMDSMKGITSLRLAHLEAGLHPIPSDLPPLPFRLTSFTLSYPTTSAVVNWILPTLTPHLRHLAVNLLVPPNIGKHTIRPLLQLVAPQLESLRIVHLKDQDDEDDSFDVRPFLGLGNLKMVGLSADIGAATGAAEYDSLMKAISPSVKVLRVARGFPLDLLAEWLPDRKGIQVIEVEQSRWIDEETLVQLQGVCEQMEIQLRLPS